MVNTGELQPTNDAADPFEVLCNRGELHQVLAFSDNPKAQRFLECLASPKFSRWRTATMARRCGVTAAEFVDMVRTFWISVGVGELVKALPDIMRATADDAKKPGDVAARKLVFETLGLTGKPAQININSSYQGGSLESVLDDAEKAERAFIDVPFRPGEPFERIGRVVHASGDSGGNRGGSRTD